MFKLIYVEITNICNLTCSYCIDNDVKQFGFLNVKNFIHIINNIKNYTNVIALHIKGEPLLHPNIDYILKICEENKIKVNLCSNGVLLNDNLLLINKSSAIRKLSISLHSQHNKTNYYDDIKNFILNVRKDLYIYFRSMNIDSKVMMKKLMNEIDRKHLYITPWSYFDWPNTNDYETKYINCLGLKQQLGILLDGSVVVCCLDYKGSVNFGNIYEKSFEDIINDNKFIKLKQDFINQNVTEKLCLCCRYKDRFRRK